MRTSIRNWALAVSAVAGLILFWMFYYAPLLQGQDPEASTHKIDRAAAEEAAVRFVAARLGHDTALQSFGMYSAERVTFGYLYKEEAIQQFTELFRDRLPLELYRVEVVEQRSGARHTVDINPYTGEPAEWNLQLQGGPLTEDELIRQADKWVEAQGWKEEASFVLSDAETGQVLYDLTIPEIKGASVQADLHIDSDGIRSSQIRWYAPEDYTEEAGRQDTVASVLGVGGLALSSALQLAAFIYAVRFNRNVSWRRGIALSVIFAVLYCAFNINMYPGIKAMVLTIAEGGDFAAAGNAEVQTITAAGLISALVMANMLTMVLAIGLYFSIVAGNEMCRRRGWNLWPPGSDSDYGNRAVSSMWKGYAFAFVMLGLQSVIFLGAEQTFGTWYTIDASTSSHNLLFPVLMPVLAWCAAISEEGVYRLFGIPALKAIFRFTTPAVIVTSMIWALGHVQYPIYPYYTRFVEVTILGLLFSYVFLKHGFMTAVFAHAVADTIWMGISITANHPSAMNWTFAAVYFVLPIVIAYAMAAFGRRRRPTEPIDGAAAP
ncbi:CPBP family intramembrane glutamic endopeptidase [Paenibacillus alkalitolerans]|uniref:CPBP family intramembrane glutamic endopeptidase n=1 Tax=Paenibacillus alkalitolerans TaxID=2799335 RepID=UPI0018F56B1F|nr:CPBP family intramembrane glutamic endopeptidase [Paenibacillus alkalitolerans]